jgi:hypothetical protein
LAAALLLLAPITAPRVARAGDIDTEHLFGFALGTDIDEVGSWEIEGGMMAGLGKRTGRYAALLQTLSLESTPIENVRLEATVAGAWHGISGVAGLADQRRGAFDGFAFDMRYRVLDREHAPFGLAVDAEPHWGRVNETSGKAVDRFGADFTLALDRELVPDRVVAAVNLLYSPETERSRLTGLWSQDSTAGIGAALMLHVGSGILVGAEARYLRSYDGAGLSGFAGQAFFLGPTVFARLSARAWLTIAWNVQVAGRSVGEPGPLDLVDFERHQATLKFGVDF